jgi:hypothetical protein
MRSNASAADPDAALTARVTGYVLEVRDMDDRRTPTIGW